MKTPTASKEQILDQLHELHPAQWQEVLDFIGYLKHRQVERREHTHRAGLTARDLLESGLVGIWADRNDIEDSLAYARRLRREAERRWDDDDDTA